MSTSTYIRWILVLAMLVLAGCGGGGGGGGGGGAIGGGGGGIDFEGVVVLNDNVFKAGIELEGIGFGGNVLDGTPLDGGTIILFVNGVEIARGDIGSDGSYDINLDEDAVSEDDEIEVVILNADDEELGRLTLTSFETNLDDTFILNVEIRSDVEDPNNPGNPGIVVYVSLPDGTELIVDNAIDIDGDGEPDGQGSMLQFPDGVIMFDGDGDGIFGEPEDGLIPGLPSIIVDGDPSDGFDNNPGDRDLAVGNIQDTIGSLDVTYTPASIQGSSANPAYSLCRVLVNPVGPDSVFGATIEVESATGSFGGENPIVVELVAGNPFVTFLSNGRARVTLSHMIPAGVTGTVTSTASVVERDVTDSGGLVVQPAGAGPAAPTVTTVTPDDGAFSGGTPVLIQGSGFVNGAVALFRGVPTPTTFVSGSLLSCFTPGNEFGLADVTVINPTGAAATLPDGFFYAIPEVFVTESGGTAVVEGISNDTYTLALNVRPRQNVTVTLEEDGDITVNPSQFIFTPGNFASAQTVTVSPVNDDIAENLHNVIISHETNSPDLAFNNLDADTVVVAVTDDDSPNVAVVETGGGTSVTEGGTTDTYTLRLTTQPTDFVTVSLSFDGDFTVNDDTFVFSTSNWFQAQTVTVTATNDQIAENEHEVEISHTATAGDDEQYNGIAVNDVDVTVVDNDTANIVRVETGGTTAVSEAGGSDVYTLALTSQPTSPVFISVTTDGQTTQTGGSFEFNSGNWSQPMTVTVQAVNDDIAEGPHSGLQFALVSSEDDFYDSFSVPNLTVSITDNDTAGFQLTGAAGKTAAEGGAGDSFSFLLNSQPTATVTVTVDPDAQTALNELAAGAPLTFLIPPNDWNSARTVTIEAVDDDVAEGAHNGVIVTSLSGADGTYSGISVPNVTVAITDNDSVGVLGEYVTGTTDEDGGTSLYTYRLNSQPTAAVTVILQPDAELTINGQGPAVPVSLNFSTLSWNQAQTVTVGAFDDNDIEDAHNGIIAHNIASADGKYNGLSVENVTVGIGDNDGGSVSLVQSDGTTAVTEGTGLDTYTIKLVSVPAQSVTITVDPDDQLRLNGLSAGASLDLTFTTGNWNVAQTVTVRAFNDSIVEHEHEGVIQHASSSGDNNFNGLEIDDVEVTITDNDFPGLVINQTGGTTNISEAGSTDIFTILLPAQPAETVTVSVMPDQQLQGNGQGQGNPFNLLFDDSNWNVAQTVTVAAIDDDFIEGLHTGDVDFLTSSVEEDWDNLVEGFVAGVTDNNQATFVIAQSDGTTEVNEAETTSDEYTIVMTSDPRFYGITTAVTVTVTIQSDEGVRINGEDPGDPATMQFTSANWFTAQTVTVTAVDDDVDEGESTLSAVAHTVAAPGTTYAGASLAGVTATVFDNDTAAIVLLGPEPPMVGEGSFTDNFSFHLDTRPTSNVTVTLNGGSQLLLAVDDEIEFEFPLGFEEIPEGQTEVQLVIVPEDWELNWDVFVEAVDDNDVEGDHGGFVNFSVNSQDPFYNEYEVTAHSVGIADNDYYLSGELIGDDVLGMLMYLTGDDNQTTTAYSDEGVFYDFIVSNGDYYVTGPAAGYEFTPTVRTVVISDESSYSNDFSVTRLMNGIESFAAGEGFSFFQRIDGTVFASGYNSYGQLGTSETVATVGQALQMEAVGGGGMLTGARQVAAGGYHGLALLQDGSVLSWGDNESEQLGAPGLTITSRSVAGAVEAVGGGGALGNATAIAAGYTFNLALLRDGRIASWGSNYDFQLGRDTGEEYVGIPGYVQQEGDEDLTGVRAISAGGSHGLALMCDGTVMSWGYDNGGQLGQGYTTYTSVSASRPVVAVYNEGGFLENVIQVAAGGSHSLALLADGSVVAWGDNDYGQLGDDSNESYTDYPVRVYGIDSDYLTNVVAIAAGDNHSLALLNNGMVVAWGDNDSGQTGTDGDETEYEPDYVLDPYTYYPLTNVIAIAAGDEHSLFLMADGTVKACGYNGSGALARWDYTGTFYTPFSSFAGACPAPAAMVGKGLAAGGDHSVIQREDGTVVAVGDDSFGQLGAGEELEDEFSKLPLSVRYFNMTTYSVSDLSNITKVASGRQHSLALDPTGTVWSWGDNSDDQLGLYFDEISTSRTARSVSFSGQDYEGYTAFDIAAGAYHNLAAVSSYVEETIAGGLVASWGGDDEYGELGRGAYEQGPDVALVLTDETTYLSNVVKVAAGAHHSMALLASGIVATWGENSTGQLGDNGDSGVDSFYAIYVQEIGGGDPLTDVTAIASGDDHCLALLCDGTVVSWGLNADGQLGDGTQVNRPAPVVVLNPAGDGPLTNVIAIAAGANHSMALLRNGTVVTWGSNSNGQLGENTLVTRLLPIPVHGIGNVGTLQSIVAIDGGGQHSLARRSDGTILSWGYNHFGQLGDNTITRRRVPVIVKVP